MNKTSTIPTLAALAALALGITSSHGAITLLNSGSFNTNTEAASFTQSFDASNSGAGTPAKLILSTHYEAAATISSITYNSVALQLIPGSATGNIRAGGIWYLDNPFSGGAANIVVTMSTPSTNMGFAYASIAADDTIVVGDVQTATSGATPPTVTLTVPVDESFVFAAFGGNQGNTSTASSPLTPITIGALSSMSADAGYENDVSSGSHGYTYISNSENGFAAVAASFHVVPEPSTSLLCGLGMLALLRRRTRA